MCVVGVAVCGQVVLQVSVAVLLDNFVAASARLENEIKEARIKVEGWSLKECVAEKGSGE